MLSHLRFHRRGASNPTSPNPVSGSVPADGQPSTAALSQARMPGNNSQAQTQSKSPHLQPQSQLKPRASSRSRSPHRSKTKSLLLLPSSFGGNTSAASFNAADLALPPISKLDKDTDGKLQRASIAVPPSALSNNNNNNTNTNNANSLANPRFIGGLALRNYQNRRHQAASSGPIAEPTAASTAPFSVPPAANTSNATLITTPPFQQQYQHQPPHLPQLLPSHHPPHPQSKPPPPPINTNLSVPGGRYSLPAQPSPGFGVSPASATLTPNHGKSPSFVTPTDMKSHQEMQQQLFAAAAAAATANAGSPTASGSSKGKQKQSSTQQPHKKTKGVTFLRPVSTLLQRRKANNSVPDMRALRGAADEPTFDPRIKGNKVHDFSAPRPKKPVTASTTPVSATMAPASVSTTAATSAAADPITTCSSSNVAAATDTLYEGFVAPAASMSATTVAVSDPSAMMPPKDTVSLPTSVHSVPSIASATAAKTDNDAQKHAEDGCSEISTLVTGSVKSRRSRKISISEISLRSSISRRMKSTSSRFSFDFIGADKQEKDLENKYRRRFPNHAEAKESEQPSAFSHGDDRFDGLDMDDFDYDAMLEDDGMEEEIPGLNLDYNEEDILEEDEDPFEYDDAYKNDYEAEDDDDVPHVGLGHMTLEDMEAADAAKEALVVRDLQSPGEANAHVAPEAHAQIALDEEPSSPSKEPELQPELESEPQTQQADSQDNHDQPQHSHSDPALSLSGLPIIAESAPEPDIVEHIIEMGFHSGDMASADSQNFGAFKFNRSNPGSELTSPLSVGLQSTPRDPEGRVIGFAISKDTPTASSSFLPLFDQEESSSGLCIRMNSPLSSTGDPDPEAVPLEMQEQFQMRAPAYERLGGLAEEQEKRFDVGANNEFADEFVTDEFTKGDDAGFDESLFDLDDTDQYGRPIPGAFANAQQKILEAREKQKRDLEADVGGDDGEKDEKGEKDGSEKDEQGGSVKESAGSVIPEPIMIPTFIPISQAQAVVADATETVSVPSPDIAHGAEMRGVGPETSPEHSRAYHAALLAATQKAFEDGKFKRESWASEALPENEVSEDNGLAGYEDEHDDVDYGYNYDDDMGGGFNMEDYENDDMDDYYDLGDTDDRKIIEEANATALANDYDGWYGQEFGFYSAPLNQHHQLNNTVKYEYSNGGFFGPAGMGNVGRTASGRVVVREPNLTPITERSEYSNRNSLMSLPGIPLPASALTSPGLAQLAMMSDHDENLSLGALLRLRSKAWGGSQASSHQGSPRSERADGTHSPLGPSMWGLGSMEGGGPLSAPLAGPTSAPAGFSFASNLTAGLHAGSLSASTSPVTASAAQFQSLIGVGAGTATTTTTSASASSGFPPPREFPLAPKAGATSGVSLNTAVGYAATGAGAGAGVGAGTGATLPDLEEEEETESAEGKAGSFGTKI